MSGFLDKLNVLVKSSLNSFLSEATGQSPSSSVPRVPAERLGKDIDKEIAALRKRIEEAVSQEEAMQKRLDEYQQQIATHDQQADQALQRGDEATARRLLRQMQQQQQMTQMLQAELEEHRRSTSDFIQRVNTLDAVVSDARREKSATESTNTEAQPGQAPGAFLSNLLRDARERIENGVLSSHDEAQPVAVNQPVDEQQIDEDLAKRRARLSKPD